MRRSLLKYLADLQQALTELEEIVGGKTLNEYLGSLQVRRATEREFILIAEVISRIRHQFPETVERIDRIAPLRNFRNILVHEYELINDETVWRNATHHAPSLHHEIDAWVMELDPSWDPAQGL